MRNYIIIAFLTIMLLGAGNSFAYKKGHAVHQTSQESHHKTHAAAAPHKAHATAAHHKSSHGGTHHKSYATHHKGKGKHHKGGAYAHHNGHAHHRKNVVVEEEVFNYPVATTPVAAPMPVQKVAEEQDNRMDNGDRDYKSYRAWKKDFKRAKKEYKARIKEAQGMPWAAERKMRKAYKKAWKADFIEHEYETGSYTEDRPFWWY
jgi:hypothetical protein